MSKDEAPKGTHLTEPGVEFWAGLGKKCSHCPCFFTNSHDMKLHLPVCKGFNKDWHRNPDGSEWCSSDTDPQLKQALIQNGEVVMGPCKYSLSGNGKWFYRRPAS